MGNAVTLAAAHRGSDRALRQAFSLLEDAIASLNDEVAPSIAATHNAMTLDVSSSIVFSLSGQRLALNQQAAACVLAGPPAGTAIPTFRALVATDIPVLAYDPAGTGHAEAVAHVAAHELAYTHTDIALNTAARHAKVTLAVSADVLLGLTGQDLSLDTQMANRVLAGPATGADAAPTFRALVAADLPTLTSLTVAGNINATKSQNSRLSIVATNANGGTSAEAFITAQSDGNPSVSLGVGCSAFSAYTTFGLSLAGAGQYYGYKCTKILYGAHGLDAPVYMGIYPNVVSSWSAGALATGVFNVAYTKEATNSTTAGVTLNCGLAVAKKIYGGSTIDAITSYSVNGTKVVGAQGAAVADATDAASVILRLNDLLARLRTHGLIAT